MLVLLAVSGQVGVVVAPRQVPEQCPNRTRRVVQLPPFWRFSFSVKSQRLEGIVGVCRTLMKRTRLMNQPKT